MAREIIIDFDADPRDPGYTLIWHFGEELYRACEKDGWAFIIDDIDKATNQLRVKVRSKHRVRRVLAMTEKLLEKHFLMRRAHLSVVAPPS